MSARKQIILLTLDRGTRFAASLASGALVARALAPDDFGILTQALLVLAILDAFSSLGIPAVISSRVAVSAETERTALLTSVLLLRSTVAVVCAMLVYALNYLAVPTSVPTGLVTALLLTLALSNWTISDGYLQGVGRPERGAIVKSIVALTYVLVRWLHIESSAPTAVSFAFIYCAEQTTLSLVMLAMCWRRSIKPTTSDNAPRGGRTPFLRHASIIWASQLMTLAYMRVDQTIISVLGERFELAEYAVAAQLAEQAYTLPIILNAVFVGRIGALQMASDPVKLQIAMSQLYRWGFVAACLLSAFAAGIAHLLVPAIYGEKYRASSTLFMILILAVPFVTLGSLQSLAILTGNYPSIQLKKTALAAFLSVPAGLLGWTLFRLHGLALSVLLVQVFACFLANWLFDRTAFQTQLSAVLHLRRYKQPLRR